MKVSLSRLVPAAGVVVGLALALSGVSIVAADPAGNNGTIKIDGIPFDTHVDNEPHVGCKFEVKFYGYDKGNLNATVVFSAQPPSGTKTLISDTVFIGEDAAGGGTDLDATRVYTLDTTGLKSQANQGYHIKLAVSAPASNGATTKYKVFWVQGCSPLPTG